MNPEDHIRQLIRAGVKPRLVWAACRTGRVVSEEIRNKLDSEEINEWEEALAEYDRTYPDDDWDMKDISKIILRDKF